MTMKNRLASILVYSLYIDVIFTGCAGMNNKKIELSFQLNEMKDFVPSNQMAIWLERPDSTFVKTLFVCEYLAYGGFRVTGICPEWTSGANWEKVSGEEFDAVTGATPLTGPVEMKLKCPVDQIPDGTYNLYFEVHLAEDYNELYSTEIFVSGTKDTKNLSVSYMPEKYPRASGDILSGVKATCR